MWRPGWDGSTQQCRNDTKTIHCCALCILISALSFLFFFAFIQTVDFKPFRGHGWFCFFFIFLSGEHMENYFSGQSAAAVTTVATLLSHRTRGTWCFTASVSHNEKTHTFLYHNLQMMQFYSFCWFIYCCFVVDGEILSVYKQWNSQWRLFALCRIIKIFKKKKCWLRGNFGLLKLPKPTEVLIVMIIICFLGAATFHRMMPLGVNLTVLFSMFCQIDL